MPEVLRPDYADYQPFVPQEAWKTDGGAVFELAHPDDELLFWESIDRLLQAGIPASVILHTLGEYGVSAGSPLTASEVKEMRKKEFTSSMNELGITDIFYYSNDITTPGEKHADRVGKFQQLARTDVPKAIIFDRQDTQLEFENPRDFSEDNIMALRAMRPRVVFSFSDAAQPDMDHGDHATVGRRTRYDSSMVNVGRLHPEYTPMDWRPDLYLLTHNRAEATHQLVYQPGSRQRRNDSAVRHYPSQFSSDQSWSRHFDAFTKINGHPEINDSAHHELYVAVRSEDRKAAVR